MLAFIFIFCSTSFSKSSDILDFSFCTLCLKRDVKKVMYVIQLGGSLMNAVCKGVCGGSRSSFVLRWHIDNLRGQLYKGFPPLSMFTDMFFLWKRYGTNETACLCGYSYLFSAKYLSQLSLFLRKFQINMNLWKKWLKGYSP